MPKGEVRAEIRCTATNRQGNRCGRARTPGRNVCKFHGGRTPTALSHPNTKTGKYSKYMPERLKGRYEELLGDKDLVTNRQEIAALETRLTELIQEVDVDVSQRTWAAWRRLWNQFILAVRAGDGLKQAELVTLMDEFMNERHQHDKAWQDIERMADTRRKLADSEHKRMVAMNQMLTVEQAMMLMASLVSAVKDVVHLYADPTAAQHIINGASTAYVELLGIEQNSSNGAGSSDGD